MSFQKLMKYEKYSKNSKKIDDLHKTRKNENYN